MRKLSVLAIAFALILSSAMGSYAASVKVLVGGQEITDINISERAALMRLEKRGNSNSDRLKLAQKELVDEALMLAEADRIKVEVTNAEIDRAFLNIARNSKLSADKLTAFLRSAGVNPQTLRDRLKANIAWGQVVQAEVAPRVNVSELDIEKQAKEQVDPSMSYDYILKEVRFIVPKGSKVSASSRTAQANQYRKSFNGCDSAVDLSMSYTDVAVIDVGRRHATQLPEALAKELGNLNIGQITKPRVADGGVSMLAVCAKSKAEDTTFIKNELRQKEGDQAYQKAIADFLETLRGRTTIVYK